MEGAIHRGSLKDADKTRSLKNSGQHNHNIVLESLSPDQSKDYGEQHDSQAQVEGMGQCATARKYFCESAVSQASKVAAKSKCGEYLQSSGASGVRQSVKDVSLGEFDKKTLEKWHADLQREALDTCAMRESMRKDRSIPFEVSNEDLRTILSSESIEDAHGVKCYLLNLTLEEKEPSVYQQLVSSFDYPREAPFENHEAAILTDLSMKLGISVFLPFTSGIKVPERPGGSGRLGFHIVSKHVVAFRGIGGRDMASIWHMLIVPRAELVMSTPSSNEAVVSLKWLYDLRPEHLPLLYTMREESLVYLQANKGYFIDVVKGRGDNLAWLEPNAVRFGFHSRPSVGYLHMHMLIGPLTDFGADTPQRIRWVSLETILEILEAGQPASSLLPKKEGEPSIL